MNSVPLARGPADECDATADHTKSLIHAMLANVSIPVRPRFLVARPTSSSQVTRFGCFIASGYSVRIAHHRYWNAVHLVTVIRRPFCRIVVLVAELVPLSALLVMPVWSFRLAHSAFHAPHPRPCLAGDFAMHSVCDMQCSGRCRYASKTRTLVPWPYIRAFGASSSVATSARNHRS